MNRYQRYKRVRDIYYSKDNWQRRDEIFKELYALVKEGYGKAASLLAHIYNEAEITEIDDKEQKHWYEVAASLGDGEGIYHQAFDYYFKDDYPTYVKQVKIAADKGYPMAMYSYALLIMHQNSFKAVEYLKKASRARYYDANYELALIFRYGLYFQNVDYKLVYYYLKKNWDNGYSRGAFMMGECYDFGIGVRKNHKKARTCYQVAVDYTTDYSAYGFLARHYIYGLGGYKKDYQKGFELLNLALEKDKDECHPLIYYELARLYEKGLGTLKDKKKATYYYDLWHKKETSDFIRQLYKDSIRSFYFTKSA